MGEALGDERVERAPKYVLPVDAAIMLVAWLLARDRSPRWFVTGAALTLVIDAVFAWMLGAPEDRPVLWEIFWSLLYLPPLLMLWSGVVGTGDVRALRAVTPLMIGVGASYVGESLYYRELVLDDQGVDQEYFAQISQIIPLLLVALGLESRLDIGRPLHAAERSVGVFTVVLLVAAEALAISTLPVDNDEVPLYGWHEFIAFAATLYACFVALSVLAVVVILTVGRRSDTPPV